MWLVIDRPDLNIKTNFLRLTTWSKDTPSANVTLIGFRINYSAICDGMMGANNVTNSRTTSQLKVLILTFAVTTFNLYVLLGNIRDWDWLQGA